MQRAVVLRFLDEDVAAMARLLDAGTLLFTGMYLQVVNQASCQVTTTR